MLFSKACEYGIKAILFVAEQSLKGKRVSVKMIAREIDGPEAFTSKVLQQLIKKDILTSYKGPAGGFQMEVHKIKEITLLEIVTAIDGTKIFTQCGLGLSECSEAFPCPVHDKFKVVRNGLYEMFITTSVHEAILGLDHKQLYLKR